MDDQSPAPEALPGPGERDAVDPLDITGPQPAVIGPFPAHHHTHARIEHPHASPWAAHDPPKHANTGGLGRGATIGAIALVLVLLGATTAWALARGADPVASAPVGVSLSPTPRASTTPTAGAPAAAGAMFAPSQNTLVLGDSLGLTVYPWLAELLPDRFVSYEAEVGRTTPATGQALDELAKVPKVVLVSSGTNDPLATDVEKSARDILDALGSERCVVWVDVVRPDAFGDTATEVNAALDRAVAGRSNVSVLRWSEMIDAHPEWLGGDGIHPTQDGAEARAQAFADASAACSPIDPEAPKAERQFLPASTFYGPISGQNRIAQPTRTRSATPSSSRTSSSTKKPKPSSTASATSPSTKPPSSSPPSSSPPPDPTPTPEPSGGATAGSAPSTPTG